jgi:hypothetical protein
MMRNAAQPLIVIKSNSPLAQAACGKERWRQTRFIFHPCRPPAYLKIKSARELCVSVSESLCVRARTSLTFSWLRAHNNLFIWKLIMVSDRFGKILQKWQKLKEKIHTTKDR